MAKEIEFINDKLKFIQKEMAAKFKHQNVSFALQDRMRNQINEIMGQINKYINGIDSSQFDRDCIDHCHL